MSAGVLGAGLLPAWFVAPVAGLGMLVLAAHILALHRSPQPASRRRLRTASGMVMLLTLPLLAYAFAVATPARPGAFVTAWTAVGAMLALVTVLATADMMNSLRLHRRAVRELRARLRETRRLVESHADAGGPGE